MYLFFFLKFHLLTLTILSTAILVRVEQLTREDEEVKHLERYDYPSYTFIRSLILELPENLDIYTELIPLEGVAPHSMSSSYRVTHRQTGEHFAMRRLHSYGTCPSKRLDVWKQIDHPNVVMMHDHLTTNAFGDHCKY